jgi:hypothetical protein
MQMSVTVIGEKYLGALFSRQFAQGSACDVHHAALRVSHVQCVR